MVRSNTKIPSVIIADQDCPKLRGEEACHCQYKDEDISSHGKLLGGSPTPTADAAKWQCPFMLEDGQQCPFTSPRSKPCDMARHQTAKHTPYRKFPCDVCGKKFNQHEHMAVHRRTHFKDQKDKCPFEGCTFEYTDPSSLARHKAVKHPNENAPRQKKRKRAQKSTHATASAPSPPALEQPGPSTAPLPPVSYLPVLEPPSGFDISAAQDPFLPDLQLPTDFDHFGVAPAIDPALEQPGRGADESAIEITIAFGSQPLVDMSLPEWPHSGGARSGSGQSSSLCGGQQPGDVGSGSLGSPLALGQHNFDFTGSQFGEFWGGNVDFEMYI